MAEDIKVKSFDIPAHAHGAIVQAQSDIIAIVAESQKKAEAVMNDLHKVLAEACHVAYDPTTSVYDVHTMYMQHGHAYLVVASTNRNVVAESAPSPVDLMHPASAEARKKMN